MLRPSVNLALWLFLASSLAAAREITGPARTSCDASYSAPCSRVNSEWLASDTAKQILERMGQNDPFVFDLVSKGNFNMETGFYPFIFDRISGRCVAHGGNPTLVGKTLHEIFADMGIGFSLSDQLHERFVEAAIAGGDWVEYMWREEATSKISNKAAFVTGIHDQYYLGVGYATEQLPLDLPCTDKYDSWCSINNVRSLVGKAQTRLNSAISLEQFETALYDISFDRDEYFVPGGHYLFLYRYDGPLKAHAHLHRFGGQKLDYIFQELNRNPQEGLDLHATLRAAADGQGDGWVQYPWKNKADEPEYTKIAYVVKIEFMEENYYLGCGYNFIMGDVVSSNNIFNGGEGEDSTGNGGETCPGYNLPCSFGSSLQLTSHSLSHCISNAASKQDVFDAITHHPQFKIGDMHTFMFDFNGTCVAHGASPGLVGKNSTDIFLGATSSGVSGLEVHNQFRDAAESGGGYVVYGRNSEATSTAKIAYIFQLTLKGRNYYGGVQFSHVRAPLQLDLDTGSQGDGGAIPCSSRYGSLCSELNSQAILGQALADLILASSGTKVRDAGPSEIGEVLTGITNGGQMYKVNDFHVAVFALDQSLCYTTEERQAIVRRDESGCCVAHGGNAKYVGKTWQDILDVQNITSIRGRDLHDRLIGQTDRGGTWTEYAWAQSSGGAESKIAFSSRFDDGDQSYYVMVEYFAKSPPVTCDACPSDMECREPGQFFCEPKVPIETFRESAGFTMLLIALVGVPCLGIFFCWVGKKKEERLTKVQFEQIDQQMQTMTKQMEHEKKTASRANKLVASLFPEQVHERIMEQMEADEVSHDSALHQKDLDSSSGDQWSNYDNTETAISNQSAICDLFPEATISFCDIAGFTEWSSTREPSQVFRLLETIYHSFDRIAKRMKVFKVETIGDCYVAVCGLPEKRADHAVVMARFAAVCQRTFKTQVKKLEWELGPDTGDLKLRWGLHSGPVTAGVLRGDRGRFQLFGDTVNTASRMESTSHGDRIQLSHELVTLLLNAGKSHWVTVREDKVVAKGKGVLDTYWLEMTAPDLILKIAGNSEYTESTSSASHVSLQEYNSRRPPAGMFADRNEGLVEWNLSMIKGILADVVSRREASGIHAAPRDLIQRLEKESLKGKTSIKEVKEFVRLPKYDARAAGRQACSIGLDEKVMSQLRSYIYGLSAMYNDNPFHNFKHATHVTTSVVKLLKRIVAPEQLENNTSRSISDRYADLHDHTYGITSDPLTQFAVVLSALIHDVDHPAVPNTQLVHEKHALVSTYGRSIAELNSFDLAWQLLMEDQYEALRRAIYSTEAEFLHFRQLVVNMVLATDIMDKDLGALRKERWNKAFKDDKTKAIFFAASSQHEEDVNRKATIVLEYLIQASDVAHTMQHWNVYLKWNERFFFECYASFKAGRAKKDPSLDWYQGEKGFLDFYVIPLAKKLKDCGVFGVSSAEYLRYAELNRKNWEAQGLEIVAGYIEKANDPTQHEDFEGIECVDC